MALRQRQETQKGALVRASLMESAIAALANQATNWLMAGHIPQRMGTLHPNIAPYGEMFETKDGKLLILSIGSDRQFLALCTCLNRLDLLENAVYKTNLERVKNRLGLADELRASFKNLIAKDILESCHQNFVPIGQVRNMQEVFEQPRAQKMILEEEIEGLSTKRVRTAAFKIGE